MNYFENVKKLVAKGITIQNACKALKIDRVNFYKKITDEQKRELTTLKATTKYHHITIWGRDALVDLDIDETYE